MNQKFFIEYSNKMDDIYKNIEEHNSNKKWKILIVFDDMTADILSNKNLNPIVAELFIRGRKLSISLFLSQSYFAVPKNIRLNSTHYIVLKVPNKRELNKLHIIIHQILTLKTWWIFTNCVLQKHILFWLLILPLHQIILHISERIF